MAQVTITQLPAADPLTGTESVPISQNGKTVQTTVADIANSPTQQQTFITVNAEPTLPNYRQLAGSTGVGLVDGGAQGSIEVTLNGVSGTLETSTNGMIAKTGGSVVGRSIQGSGTGVAITNGDGVAGNPVVALTGAVGTINGLAGTGIMALQAGSTVGAVNIVGTANEITVVDGDGQSNPTIGIADNPVIPGVEGMVAPVGNTADRSGAPANGEFRYNSQTNRFEGYQNSGWQNFGIGDGTVTSVDVSGGTTGLTTSGGPITGSGTITFAGTLVAANGGTGNASYTAGDILYASGATTLSKLGIGSNTFILSSDGTSPVWIDPATLTAADIAGGAANQIVYQVGTSNTGFITAPTNPDTFLKWTGSAFTWGTIAGAGTVTSVGLALPSEFTISNSPVTGSGTLTGAWASQTANYVLAAPDGAPGTPSFRALTATDVPTAGAVANAVTFDTTGGDAAGASFDGSAAVAVDYSTVGAPATDGTGATGSWGIDITGNADTATTASAVANSVTFDDSGTGDASPQTFDGSAAVTVSYNTLGAANSGANTNITSIDSITGGISTPDFINFENALVAAPTTVEGGLYYNDDDNTRTLELVGRNGINLKLDEEQYYRVKASSNITKGQVVMITGTVGASGGLIGAPATGLTALQTTNILGVATESISTNNWGYVTFFGEIRGLDTTGGAETWVDGTVLYYDPAVTGGLTKNKPAVPNAIAIVAAVVHANASNGILFIRPTFGSVLGGTDGNVNFGTLAGGDIIVYDSGNQYWENAAQSTLTAGKATNLAGGLGGSVPYQSAVDTTTFLGIGANTYLMTSTGSAPQWSDPAGVTVGTATNATNATNVTTTATSTNATYYVTFVDATTGNNGIEVDADITYNPSTNTLTTATVVATTGISGGTF